jgi:hypothetical protein
MRAENYQRFPNINLDENQKENEETFNEKYYEELKDIIYAKVEFSNSVKFSYFSSEHFKKVRVISNFLINSPSIICKSLLYHLNGSLIFVKAKVLILPN